MWQPKEALPVHSSSSNFLEAICAARYVMVGVANLVMRKVSVPCAARATSKNMDHMIDTVVGRI